MSAINLTDLKPKQFFSRDLYLDQGYVLLAPETPVTEELVNRLTRWEFRQLQSEGLPVDAPTESEGEGEGEGSVVFADGTGDRERVEKVIEFLSRFSDYIDSVYTRFVTKNELDYRELLDRVKGLCETLGENRRYVLRALSVLPTPKNYLVSHAVRSTIISIIMGTALKMPQFRLIELGTAAALHEIGMVKLPSHLYMAGRQLSPTERQSVMTHTILGYNLLKDKQVPLAVCLAALEHHERMSGAGYPRKLTGEKISLYSRIIMVACSYDAVTAVRPYKEAKEASAGIVELLKNEGKQYDDTVIKTLVFSLSIFPIGSHVLLSSGKPALVVDVNPDNPRYPVVQVLGSKTPDGKDLVVATSETGARVLRSLTKAESEKLQAG
jgi:HD-GYP domain-containing protein (c-di-GMP phosphodiesterase class II)